MGFFNKLVHGAANIVHNDVVAPVQRDAVQPVLGAAHQLFGGGQPQQGPAPAPMQQINLMHGGLRQGNQLVPAVQQQQGNQARLNAQKQLQFTPSFAQNVANAAPYTGQPAKTAALTNTSGAGAEFLGNSQPNQIVLGNNSFGQTPTTVLHEGLHRVYANSPQVRQQFAQAYNSSATPAIKNYLTMRLTPYQGFSGGLDAGGVPKPNYDLSNMNNLPPNLQNEAHSFLSELPSTGETLPPALNTYYSQYFNAPNVAKQAFQQNMKLGP